MTPIPSCPVHIDYPRNSCMECVALRNSLHTRALVTARRAAPTPAQQADWDVLRQRYESLGWEDVSPPQMKSALQILEDIERMVDGEVE